MKTREDMAIAGLDRTPFVRRCDRLSKKWGDLSKGVPNERYMAGSKKLVVETMRQGPLFEEPEADRPHLPFFPKCYDVLLAATGRLLIRCVGGPNKKEGISQMGERHVRSRRRAARRACGHLGDDRKRASGGNARRWGGSGSADGGARPHQRAACR